MKLNETQQAFKDGYTKARHEDEKWYKDFLRHLQELETKANENIDEIPEEFEDLQDSENYNYYQGVLETVKNIKEFLGVQ